MASHMCSRHSRHKVGPAHHNPEHVLHAQPSQGAGDEEVAVVGLGAEVDLLCSTTCTGAGREGVGAAACSASRPRGTALRRD